MPITYEKFMTHAARLLKTTDADLSERPVIKGVKHYENGSCAMTDSHRLYVAKDVHQKQDGAAINPSTLKKIEGSYPDIFRLLQIGETKEVYEIDIAELLYVADVAVTFDENSNVVFRDSILSLHSKQFLEMQFQYSSDVTFIEPFAVRAQYLLDAMKLLKDAGCKVVKLQFRGAFKPLLMEHDNVTALLLPVKI